MPDLPRHEALVARVMIDRLRRAGVLAISIVALSAMAAVGGDAEPDLAEDADQDSGGSPTVVVTTAVLGSVVSDLVGQAAQVRVLMPGGIDPHTWQPSARDTESRCPNRPLLVRSGRYLAVTDGECQSRKSGGRYEPIDPISIHIINFHRSFFIHC